MLDVVRELTGAPGAALIAETPLMEAVVDSLAATELASLLRSVAGLSLSPTLLFEQPTARAIAAHMLEQLVESAGAAAASPVAACSIAALQS